MPLTDTSTIILVVALVVVAALLVWLSLSMAAAESAVGRVTRAGLNNKILEVQTDTETSQFIRMKKIGKIHTVQRLIANRYATSGSCAFFRITCNVFDGVLVACVASLLDAPIWLQLLTREIMVPRTDMICMDRTATLADMLRLCSRSGFSRVPVIGDDVDDLIGVAYLKDAVRATAFNPAASQRDVASIVRQPMLVPESKPVDDLFHAMQQTRQHVAIVVDEYGGIAGLVTIEDTIEQIVGELEDEHDRTQHSEPEKIGERKWKMPARTPIATLEEMFEIDIDEDDVDTVYGLLTKLLGRVPIVGSSAVTRGLRLTAVDTAGRRKRVSMIVVEPAAGSQGPAADDDELRSDEQDGESASPQGK